MYSLHRKLGKRAVKLIAQAVKRLTGACRLAGYCKSMSEIFSTSARYKVRRTHLFASRRSTDD